MFLKTIAEIYIQKICKYEYTLKYKVTSSSSAFSKKVVLFIALKWTLNKLGFRFFFKYLETRTSNQFVILFESYETKI